MNHRSLLVAAVVLSSFTVTSRVVQGEPPAPQPAQRNVAEIERTIAEAKQRIEAAQADVAALQRQLSDAEAAETAAVIDRARAGDEAALRAVVEQVASNASFVAYEQGHIARGMANPKPLLQAIEQAWASASPRGKGKLAWMLGVNGSADAAARLRAALAAETDPDVLGNAIFALSRCPSAPQNLDAVRRHAGDTRFMTTAFGFNPRGWFGPNEAGKTGDLQPLGLIAREYVMQHDAAHFATTPAEVTVQPATIHCAGFVWDIAGDSNRNCAVTVAYRKAGTSVWKAGFPFIRCESWETPDPKYPFNVGEKLAGSIFDLEPETEYEVKLTLKDADGGAAETTVTTRTIAEPPIYAGERTLHVAPGAGGGSGTKEDPFRGIAAADAAAQPGDVMLLGPGRYPGAVSLKKSGAAGKPIVWRGADADQVILDGSGEDECLSFSGQSHLQFEHLSFTGASQGCIKTFGSQDVVVRRCKFFKFRYGGIVAQGQPRKTGSGGKVTGGRNTKNWFVLDNEITGPKDWKKDRGSASSYGVNVSGERNVIAYNRITDMWDCISLTGDNGTEPRTSSTDVYANDLRQAADDGVEADYTFHNVRVFRNRLVNTFSTLSAQPTFGGPTYFLYNAMYNTTNKPFKLHVNSTGLIIAHNTAAVSRETFYGGTFHNALFRNNLLLGLPGQQGYWMSTDGYPIDMDYGGYNVAAPGRALLNLNNVRYQTMQDAAEDAGIMSHGVQVDWDVFTNAAPPPGDDQYADEKTSDITLRKNSKAVDAGVPLPGINDDFTGKAPDLGCYEAGRSVPAYGPRPIAAKP